MTKVVYIISDIDKALAFEWIAEKLDRSKFALSFILLNEGPSQLETFLLQQNIPVTRIACGGKKQWPSAWWKLVRTLNKINPEVVHCHLFTASLLGLSAATFLGIKSRIYTRHHSDFHFRYHPKGVKWDKLCNRLATRIVAPSQVVFDVLTKQEHCPAKKIEIIHHGFKLDYFAHPNAETLQALRMRYNPSDAHPVIGVIARFTKLKGIQFIIPAFANVRKRFPDARLMLFNARGDYEREIRAMLADLPAGSFETVHFEAQLAEVYPLFDVFVQVSTDRGIEAFGQTYVEAAASGIPSVVTLAGVANDFMRDEQNALVVPYENAEAIEDAIVRLLENPDLAKRLSTQARADVHKMFSLETMIDRLERLYQI